MTREEADEIVSDLPDVMRGIDRFLTKLEQSPHRGENLLDLLKEVSATGAMLGFSASTQRIVPRLSALLGVDLEEMGNVLLQQHVSGEPPPDDLPN